MNREWFVQQMMSKGLSLRGLAKILDMDPGALSRTFNGERRMQIREVKGLAEVFRASEAEVLSHAHILAPSEKLGFSEMPQAQLTPPREPQDTPLLISGARKDSKGRQLSPLFGALKGTTIVMPDANLTGPADPEWSKVYDDDHDFGPLGRSAAGKRN